MFKDKQRWKNIAMWISLAASIAPLGALFLFHLTPEKFWAIEDAVKTIVDILVILGIIQNPATVNRWFSDDLPKVPGVPEKPADLKIGLSQNAGPVEAVKEAVDKVEKAL